MSRSLVSAEAGLGREIGGRGVGSRNTNALWTSKGILAPSTVNRDGVSARSPLDILARVHPLPGSKGEIMSSLRSLAPPSVILALATASIHQPLVVSACLATVAALFTATIIPVVADVFIQRGRSGQDRLKSEKPLM
ncbi:hypothetical protein BDK51DRAFT_38856 [Blyttiomyces helicus]|uniref:Uncharacterized protein n=1 Tax=Blyttiomyces helicus TaxID=388810 RepID=A0A4P9W5M8_9FUNG|nr:hypothetical protein BDK51DRAFT_38856 [Blyttiomyces helicus]|eukprot:RKO87719.1 hypothetical protein BDK51DRAFT_38856 [Blyttiomyces helicus]